MRILVIDDANDFRRIMKLILGRHLGHEVLEAADGREGLSQARAAKPDCILLDLIMPDPDGHATLQALKQDPVASSIPVVMLTGRDSDDERRRLLQGGAASVVWKSRPATALMRELAGLLHDLRCQA